MSLSACVRSWQISCCLSSFTSRRFLVPYISVGGPFTRITLHTNPSRRSWIDLTRLVMNSLRYATFHNQTVSEAANRIHPRRGALLYLVFCMQWALSLIVATIEPNYELTYGQARRRIRVSRPILTICLDFGLTFIVAHCRRMHRARFPGTSPAESSLPSFISPTMAQSIQGTVG